MNRIGSLPVDLYSAICDDNNNNNNNSCSVYPQLPPVIGATWGYCGRGFLLPVDYGSVGVQLTRLRRLNQGTLTSICVRTREFFLNSCTDISRTGKTCPYSTAVVLLVLIFCI